jgi:AraC-like DNA-binding protein
MSELTELLPEDVLRRKSVRRESVVPQGDLRSQHAPSCCPEMKDFAGMEMLGSSGFVAGLPAARLKSVLAFIDQHLDQTITLADLARNARLSVFYFATLFKRSTGLSPHRYILCKRVTRASELLRNTNLSVLEVSLDLGFQHQNNFTRAFRRVTGMTPTHFRRRSGLER